MRIRSVLEECEVHVRPVQPGSNVGGKSEWKHSGDGTYRFKLTVRNLPLADGSQVDLWRNRSWLLRLTVQEKTAKVDLESDNNSGIPAI